MTGKTKFLYIFLWCNWRRRSMGVVILVSDSPCFSFSAIRNEMFDGIWVLTIRFESYCSDCLHALFKCLSNIRHGLQITVFLNLFHLRIFVLVMVPNQCRARDCSWTVWMSMVQLQHRLTITCSSALIPVTSHTTFARLCNLYRSIPYDYRVVWIVVNWSRLTLDVALMDLVCWQNLNIIVMLLYLSRSSWLQYIPKLRWCGSAMA